jgi:hypothetical protein
MCVTLNHMLILIKIPPPLVSKFFVTVPSFILHLLLYYLESISSSSKEASHLPFKKEPSQDKGKSLITKKADFSIGNLDGKFWGDFNAKDEDNDSCGNPAFNFSHAKKS